MATDAVVTVRLFAGARAAAGTDRAEMPAGTLADVLDALGRRHGPELSRVLPRCSFLVDGVSRRDPATPLPPGATLDVLPPFAGG